MSDHSISADQSSPSDSSNRTSQEIPTSWPCTLLFNVNGKKPDGGQVLVDLCKFLDPDLSPPSINFPRLSVYMFPKRFLGEESWKELVKELKIAALRSGYKLSSNGKYNADSTRRRTCQAQFFCSWHKGVAKKAELRTGNYKKKINANGDLCPFKLYIFCLKSDDHSWPNRWFLSTSPQTRKDTCTQHCHHHQLPPEHLVPCAKVMTKEEIVMAQEMERREEKLNRFLDMTKKLFHDCNGDTAAENELVGLVKNFHLNRRIAAERQSSMNQGNNNNTVEIRESPQNIMTTSANNNGAGVQHKRIRWSNELK